MSGRKYKDFEESLVRFEDNIRTQLNNLVGTGGIVSSDPDMPLLRGIYNTTLSDTLTGGRRFQIRANVLDEQGGVANLHTTKINIVLPEQYPKREAEYVAAAREVFKESGFGDRSAESTIQARAEASARFYDERLAGFLTTLRTKIQNIPNHEPPQSETLEGHVPADMPAFNGQFLVSLSNSKSGIRLRISIAPFIEGQKLEMQDIDLNVPIVDKERAQEYQQAIERLLKEEYALVPMGRTLNRGVRNPVPRGGIPTQEQVEHHIADLIQQTEIKYPEEFSLEGIRDVNKRGIFTTSLVLPTKHNPNTASSDDEVLQSDKDGETPQPRKSTGKNIAITIRLRPMDHVEKKDTHYIPGPVIYELNTFTDDINTAKQIQHHITTALKKQGFHEFDLINTRQSNRENSKEIPKNFLTVSFESQVGNLVDVLFAPSVSPDQQEAAYRAINTVLATHSIAQLTPEEFSYRTTLKERLIEGINVAYENEPDKLGKFLEDVQKTEAGLPDDNPLKTYENCKILPLTLSTSNIGIHRVLLVRATPAKRMPSITWLTGTRDEGLAATKRKMIEEEVLPQYLLPGGEHEHDPLTLQAITNYMNIHSPERDNARTYTVRYDIRNITVDGRDILTLFTPEILRQTPGYTANIPFGFFRGRASASDHIQPLNTFDRQEAILRGRVLQTITQQALVSYFSQPEHRDLQIMTESDPTTGVRRFSPPVPGETAHDNTIYLRTLIDDVVAPALIQYNRYIVWDAHIKREANDRYKITAEVLRNLEDDGPIDFQVSKLVDALFAPPVMSNQTSAAYDTINAVLTAHSQPELIPEEFRDKNQLKAKLISTINTAYEREPDKLGKFLEDVQKIEAGLPDDNPLKTYNRHGELVAEQAGLLRGPHSFYAKNEEEAQKFADHLNNEIVREQYLFSRERDVDQFGVRSMGVAIRNSLITALNNSPNITYPDTHLFNTLISGHARA